VPAVRRRKASGIGPHEQGGTRRLLHQGQDHLHPLWYLTTDNRTPQGRPGGGPYARVWGPVGVLRTLALMRVSPGAACSTAPAAPPTAAPRQGRRLCRAGQACASALAAWTVLRRVRSQGAAVHRSKWRGWLADRCHGQLRCGHEARH
jgi:hypothetical protein